MWRQVNKCYIHLAWGEYSDISKNVTRDVSQSEKTIIWSHIINHFIQSNISFISCLQVVQIYHCSGVFLYLSCQKCKYDSPSNEGRHIVLVWFFLLPLLPLLLLLLLSEACLDHNFFVFPDRSMIFGMWVHDHKAVCHVV